MVEGTQQVAPEDLAVSGVEARARCGEAVRSDPVGQFGQPVPGHAGLGVVGVVEVVVEEQQPEEPACPDDYRAGFVTLCPLVLAVGRTRLRPLPR